MRERRGYGKADVKSDDHDITRVQRNLKDRREIEFSILELTEGDISQVVDFFNARVLDGVTAATSKLSTIKKDDSNILRQCIARRRMDWLSIRIQQRFHQLLDREGASLLPFDVSDGRDCIYQKDMLAYVHGWPKNDIRPPYTGLGTIISISKDKHNRPVFEVSLSDNKYISAVPEAVCTIPTDEDFKDEPKRRYTNWLKWKKNQDLPLMRQRLLKDLDKMEWDPSLIRSLTTASASESSPEIQGNILRSLKWEVSEELLFLLVKSKRLSTPFDEEIWCPLAKSLLSKCLHLLADNILMGRDKAVLAEELMGLACDACRDIENVINRLARSQGPTLKDLGFLEKSSSAQADVQVLVTQAVHINRLTLEAYADEPEPLDLEWYLVHQVIQTVHPIASLINWGPRDTADGRLYSIEKLCDRIGLDDCSYLPFYVSRVQEWQPLL